jgi:hypothetical protein
MFRLDPHSLDFSSRRRFGEHQKLSKATGPAPG